MELTIYFYSPITPQATFLPFLRGGARSAGGGVVNSSRGARSAGGGVVNHSIQTK